MPLEELEELARRLALELDFQLLVAIAAEMAQCDSGAPELCGRVYEQRLASRRTQRRAIGSYYTPAWLVEQVLARCMAAGDRVLDPACGGGAFLLAAWRRGAALLAGIDVDPGAVAVCRLALALEGVPAAAVHLEVADALLAPAHVHAPFDAVIGNPPWGQKGFRFAPSVAAALRRRYRTAGGVLDPFKLFVELAHERTRASGRWGLVLPDIVLLKNQAPLRALVLTETSLEHILDCGRVFASVQLDAVALIARKGPPSTSHRTRIWRREASSEKLTERASIAQRVFFEQPGHKLNIHLTDAILARLRRLAPLPRLASRFEIHEGVHSGNVRHKLFVAAPGPHRVPLIIGRGELARYRLRWAGGYLDRSPGLVDKVAGEYANLGRRQWHERAKIVVRRTGDLVIAALDERGVYVSNNAFVVVPRQSMETDELRAWVGYLNSALITWYFRAVQPRTGRLFAELKIAQLGEFPVPQPCVWHAHRQRIAALVAEVGHGQRAELAALAELDRCVERMLLGEKAPASAV